MATGPRKGALVAIGLGQFGLSVLQTMFMFYYVKVFLNKFHVQTWWFNLAQTLFMIWNAINDPLFGYLQEVPGTWLNNRQKVIRLFSPFIVGSFIFMWFPWNTSGSDSEGIHLILSLFFYDAFFSAIGVAWGALFADTTADQPQLRVKAMKYSQIAILLSVNCIAITEKTSHSLQNFTNFQIVICLISLISFFCLWTAGGIEARNQCNKDDSEENDDLNELIDDNRKKPLTFSQNLKYAIETTKQVVYEKSFLAIILTNFLQTSRSIAHMNFASIATELIIPQDILPSGSFRLSIFFAVLTLGPQLILIFNEKAINKAGSFKVLQFSYIISFFSGFLLVFSSSPYLNMIFMIIDSITVHTIAPMFNIIISDFVDEDARKNNRGSGIPSIIFSLNALFIKPAQSLAPVLIVHILNGSGYQEYVKSKIATPELRNTMLYILYLTPLLLGSTQYIVMKQLYKIRAYKRLDAQNV
ncbi:unnamed protein product [Caenorhabditis bovis]|uniref:MFS transporter n=1 Tax=Caenorhabditis bovis TaxID=2654633 RepID=A0A8S1F3L7_9PELO|nr:unnamed protein product [Caenorhabditis bovis]